MCFVVWMLVRRYFFLHCIRFYHGADRPRVIIRTGRKLFFSCRAYNNGRVAGDHSRTPQNEMIPAAHPSMRLSALLSGAGASDFIINA
jgi:hypothetical protein